MKSKYRFLDKPPGELSAGGKRLSVLGGATVPCAAQHLHTSAHRKHIMLSPHRPCLEVCHCGLMRIICLGYDAISHRSPRERHHGDGGDEFIKNNIGGSDGVSVWQTQ